MDDDWCYPHGPRCRWPVPLPGGYLIDCNTSEPLEEAPESMGFFFGEKLSKLAGISPAKRGDLDFFKQQKMSFQEQNRALNRENAGFFSTKNWIRGRNNWQLKQTNHFIGRQFRYENMTERCVLTAVDKIKMRI